jgi:hypothetical protein
MRLETARTAKAPPRAIRPPDQGQRARRGRKRLPGYGRGRGRDFHRRRRGHHLGELHGFAGRLDGHDRRPLHFHNNGLVRQFGRFGDFDGERSLCEEDGRVSGQDTPTLEVNAGYFHRTAEGDHGLSVPVVCLAFGASTTLASARQPTIVTASNSFISSLSLCSRSRSLLLTSVRREGRSRQDAGLTMAFRRPFAPNRCQGLFTSVRRLSPGLRAAARNDRAGSRDRMRSTMDAGRHRIGP